MADEEFSAFYAATYQRLLGQLVLLCGDRAEAEDALQEAFARAAVRWRRLRSYQAPEAWVRRVALNLTRMAARRLRRRTAALLRLGSAPAAAELSAETIDLLVALRALPLAHGGRTPAAALTAFARAEDRTRALRAGYQTHVTKPVEATELTAVVASLAERR